MSVLDATPGESSISGSPSASHVPTSDMGPVMGPITVRVDSLQGWQPGAVAARMVSEQKPSKVVNCPEAVPFQYPQHANCSSTGYTLVAALTASCKVFCLSGDNVAHILLKLSNWEREKIQ